MIVGTVPKTSYEAFNVSVDFTSRLPSGVTISTLAVTATDNSGADATAVVIASSPAPSFTGLIATFRVQGGVAGSQYYALVQIVGSDGEKYQATVGIGVTTY